MQDDSFYDYSYANKITEYIEGNGIDIQNALTIFVSKFNIACLGKS
ncbi:hypothetical protein KBC85_01635 [Candidatus Saccharibacteria bacterium]|nr:hypothetical protein [Candidatus Saccharibacteria bacterium]MDQ5885247.1 hypothetical protein [Patescibacteria group bacterium]MDQ5954036.1 hypothetical protein [Patescibacteria group bacterium]MDQ5958903.1 hypothetical protein [Patescibacteria group bacterium]